MASTLTLEGDRLVLNGEDSLNVSLWPPFRYGTAGASMVVIKDMTNRQYNLDYNNFTGQFAVNRQEMIDFIEAANVALVIP